MASPDPGPNPGSDLRPVHHLVTRGGSITEHETALDTDLLPVYLLRFDREQTRRAYRNDITQLFESEFITLRMARELTFVHLNEHVQQLQEDGLRPSTLRRKISAIRGFYSWLEALNLVDANPANKQLVRRVDRNAKGQSTITVLTKEQARRLIDATVHNGESAVRDRGLLLVMIHCALRRSEASGMDVQHVHAVGPYWVLDLPRTKGGADEYVKVPPHVVEAVEEVKSYYHIAEGPLWRSLSRNDSRGNRLSPDGIYGVVRRTAARAGLDADVGAHTLRHTGCTLAIEAGATPQQVQTHARHKRLETTMGYIHQRDKLRDSAADYIDLG
jgi:site-specific recombinase XerD